MGPEQFNSSVSVWAGRLWSACSRLQSAFSASEEQFESLMRNPLCWSSSNSSDAIFSALYDGSGVIEILRGHEYLSHPFAVSLFGGSVYWTDWRTNTLARANKWTGQNVTVIQKTSAQPFDLQIFHPSRQPQGKAAYLASFFLSEIRGHRRERRDCLQFAKRYDLEVFLNGDSFDTSKDKRTVFDRRLRLRI